MPNPITQSPSFSSATDTLEQSYGNDSTLPCYSQQIDDALAQGDYNTAQTLAQQALAYADERAASASHMPSATDSGLVSEDQTDREAAATAYARAQIWLNGLFNDPNGTTGSRTLLEGYYLGKAHSVDACPETSNGSNWEAFNRSKNTLPPHCDAIREMAARVIADTEKIGFLGEASVAATPSPRDDNLWHIDLATTGATNWTLDETNRLDARLGAGAKFYVPLEPDDTNKKHHWYFVPQAGGEFYLGGFEQGKGYELSVGFRPLFLLNMGAGVALPTDWPIEASTSLSFCPYQDKQATYLGLNNYSELQNHSESSGHFVDFSGRLMVHGFFVAAGLSTDGAAHVGAGFELTHLLAKEKAKDNSIPKTTNP